MDSYSRNYFGIFATKVTTATQQMNTMVDETCGYEMYLGINLVT